MRNSVLSSHSPTQDVNVFMVWMLNSWQWYLSSTVLDSLQRAARLFTVDAYIRCKSN